MERQVCRNPVTRALGWRCFEEDEHGNRESESADPEIVTLGCSSEGNHSYEDEWNGEDIDHVSDGDAEQEFLFQQLTGDRIRFHIETPDDYKYLIVSRIRVHNYVCTRFFYFTIL